MSRSAFHDDTAGVVLVTGASAGLGAALAQELTARGRAVVGLGRSAEGLERTLSGCAPGLFHPRCADVADPAALRRIVADAERDLGPVTVLINNAAVYGRADFVSTPAEDTLGQVAINLGGYVNATAAVLPYMAGRGQGRIVNVGSLAGEGPVPGSLAYSVSKLACHGFDRALAIELAGRLPGITVSEWIPGILATGMGLADGLPPATAAVWGATLALDPAPELHGTRFLGDRQMLPARSFKRRIKDMLLLRRPLPARILSAPDPQPQGVSA